MPASEVPDIAITFNGTELAAEYYRDLVDVEIQDDVESPSACKISLVAWNDKKLDVSRVDEKLFDMGSEIEIKLGYVSSTVSSVFVGDVVNVELDLSSGQYPRLTVRGYDMRHRLRRGSKTHTFRDAKDSDMASQIARDNNLSAKVEDSGLKRVYVAQGAKSDLDFLHERAALIGYEVVVEGKNLHFRPPKASGPPIAIRADTDLTDLSARLKASDQVGAVEVRGWDPTAKKGIVGRSSGAPPPGADGDAAYGSKAMIVIVDGAISKQDDADKAANAAFDKRARKGMTIEGSALGRNDLRAGVEIDLQGIGQRFSGAYRLLSVTHRFSAKSGYVTSFSGERKLT